MNAARTAALVAALLAAAAAVLWVAARDGDPERASAPPAAREPLPPVALLVAPTLEDRFVRAPCNVVPGGGLYSLAAFMDASREIQPLALGLFMGDLTLAPGELGRHTAAYHYQEVLPLTRVQATCAGEGELGLGVAFVREVLSRLDSNLMCANAVDPSGAPVLRAFRVATSDRRTLAIVAVCAASLEPDLVARGSDVRLLPEIPAAAEALAAAESHARSLEAELTDRVLLVHGTLEETRAVVEAVPGFDVAVAAHGGLLPLAEPVEVGGTAILYPGRGMRFAYRYMRPGRPDVEPLAELVRLGNRLLAEGSPYASSLQAFRELMVVSVLPDILAAPETRPADPRGDYVGAEACGECHPAQLAAHRESDHARPPEPLLASSLVGSTQCMPCHVTAPYHRTGWKGPKDESLMTGISCEACHGPGSEHVALPIAGWGRVPPERCLDCHQPERSPGFDPQEAWERAGHGGVR